MSEVNPEPGKAPKQQRSVRTINRILDAAAECICEIGYARSSTMEIAKRAGVSQGAIFRHFATRVDLCAAVAERQMSRYRSLFEGSLSLTEAPAQQRRDGMAFIRWACMSDDSLVLLELADASRSDAELAARYTPLWNALHREISLIAGGLSWPEGLSQQQVATLAGVHIRQYQRIEYGERPMGSINMRFGLAVCAILEINPFDLVSFTADGWEIIPRDDNHTRG